MRASNKGQNVYQKTYYWRTKLIVLEHYGGGKVACVRCGFSDLRALSIDHIYGHGNGMRLVTSKSMPIYYWLKKNNYPEGYQTLCMNCQCIKRVQNGEVKGGKSNSTG